MSKFPALGVAIACLLGAASAPAHATLIPGPSPALYASPYYACGKNYYVATTGNDANSGTSVAKPWKTLQHANDEHLGAGACINVAAGTYRQGVLISNGGTTASKNGYLVYRCAKLDACIVTDVAAGGQNGSFVWDASTQPMKGNYVFIDGFTLQAARETVFGQGVELWDGNDTVRNSPNSVHHVWIINSVISGYGQSGVQMNDGEYFFVLHNTIFNNSHAGCAAQGSGVSFAELKAVAGYKRTADDWSNPLLGYTGAFNNAVEWNVVYNNAETQCGTAKNPYDSDGNNIIMDTLDNTGGTGPVYPGAVLIAFNVTYNAGGRGIHIFRSENITVANNSCYNSALDPYDTGTYRPCIGDNESYNDSFINNIAYGIVGAGSGPCSWQGKSITCLAWNSAYTGGLLAGATKPDKFTSNISYCVGTQPYAGCNPMYNGDSFPCTTNKCSTDPGWVSVGAKTTGSETSPPVAANFALKKGSAAIGKGLKAAYLSTQSVDIGACSSALTTCPLPLAQPAKRQTAQAMTRSMGAGLQP